MYKIKYILLKYYFLFLVKRNYNKIVIDIPIISTNDSVLVLPNHISWWDGFIALYLNKYCIKKNFNIVMLNEQLKNYPYFKGLGAFGINPGKRSVLKEIADLKIILRNPQNAVFFFPEGEIGSQLQDKIQIKPGVNQLLDSTTQLLMLVQITENFNTKKPNCFIYGQLYNKRQGSLEESYNLFKKKVVENHSKMKF